jgi:hypothetical protein
MSRPHPKDVQPPKPANEPAKEPAGKVVVDNRGRNVWKWAKDVIESTSVLLKRLEVKDLALEPTRKVPILGRKVVDKGANPKAAKRPDARAGDADDADDEDDAHSGGSHPALQGKRSRDGGGGFDPYNSR